MEIVLHNNPKPKRSHRKKYLYQLILARSDVDAALNACKTMLESVDGIGHDLYYPLYASIVICYARPFTNNKPFGALPNKWNKFNNSKYKDIHLKLITARHELIAHSDAKVRKAMIVPPGVSIGKLKDRELKSANIGTQTSIYAFPIKFFESVHDTALDLGCRINQEIDNLVLELYGGMELPKVAFSLRIDEGL